MFRSFLLVLSFMLLQTSAWADEAAEFWQELKAGGKVVLIRHAEIDRSMGDSFLLDESCFSEKNLNELGQQQAKQIGQAFSKHAINIYKVYASPHCRTKDTAQLAFENFTINPILRLTKALNADKAEENLAKTRSLIGSFQQEGILILVTHRPNIGELAHIRVEPAEMVLIEPLGDDEYDIIGRLRLL